MSRAAERGVTAVNYLLPVENDTLLSARRNRRLEAQSSSSHQRRASGRKRSARKAMDGAVLGGVRVSSGAGGRWRVCGPCPVPAAPSTRTVLIALFNGFHLQEIAKGEIQQQRVPEGECGSGGRATTKKKWVPPIKILSVEGVMPHATHRRRGLCVTSSARRKWHTARSKYKQKQAQVVESPVLRCSVVRSSVFDRKLTRMYSSGGGE